MAPRARGVDWSTGRLGWFHRNASIVIHLVLEIAYFLLALLVLFIFMQLFLLNGACTLVQIRKAQTTKPTIGPASTLIKYGGKTHGGPRHSHPQPAQCTSTISCVPIKAV